MRKYSGPIDRKKYARSTITSQEELDYLSRSDISFVREEVAKNPSTSIETLSSLIPNKLVTEDDFKISIALLKNTEISSDIVSKILMLSSEALPDINPREFYQPQLIEDLTNHKLPPLDNLKVILDSDKSPKHLRGRIAGSSNRVDVLKVLSNDVSEKVRKLALKKLDEIGSTE